MEDVANSTLLQFICLPYNILLLNIFGTSYDNKFCINRCLLNFLV